MTSIPTHGASIRLGQILTAGAVTAVVVSMIAALSQRLPTERPRTMARYSFDNNVEDVRRNGRIDGQWRLGAYGLALLPGQTGAVEIDIPADVAAPDQPLTAALWFYADESVLTRVECAAGAGERRTLASGSSLSGASISLRPCQAGDGITLQLSASYAAGAGDEKLVVDQVLIVRGGPRQPPWSPPHPAAPWLLLASGVIAGGAAIGRSSLLRVTIVLASSIAAAWVSVAGAGPTWTIGGLSWTWPMAAAALVGIVCHVAVLRRCPDTEIGQNRMAGAAIALVVVAIAVAGLAARGEALRHAVFQELAPDASTVIAIQEQAMHPYDTAFREPLWIWAVSVLRAVTNDAGTAIRAFSMIASFGLMLAVGAVMYGFTRSGVAAALVTWLAARHPYLIESAARGLRTEAYALGLLLIVYLAFAFRWAEHRRTVALAVALATTTLLQMSAAVAAAPILAIAVLFGRLPIRAALVAGAVTALALAPHVVNNLNRFGDPLYSVNMHAVFYRNYEFVVQGTGCEGCPSRTEMSGDSYTGAPTTMTRYIFGMHGLREVVSRVASGYASALFVPGLLQMTLYGVRSPWAPAVVLVGAVALVWLGAGSVLLLPIFGINLLAFVIPLGIDPRLLVQVVPALLMAMAAPAALLDRWAVPAEVRQRP